MRRVPCAVPPLLLWECVLFVLAPTTALAAPAGPEDPPPPPLARPVGGQVLRGFEAPEQRWGAGHRGVDLAGSSGEQVQASAAGVVAFVGRVVDREVVSVEHPGGYRTTYAPVRAVVRPGQQVTTGELLGHLLSSRECATGCLHWGLRRGQDYLDPTAGAANPEVRLLPEGTVLPPPPLLAAPWPAPQAMPAGDGPAPQASSRGLVRPSSGPVTSRFGPRLHPVLRRWKLHDGLDLGAGCGTPVHAATAGRVVLVEANIAYGNRVVVDHGTVSGVRLRTSYNHLSSVAVSPGQHVVQGQGVGRVGSTGYSTGCHLHFMLWRDGIASDPERWLR